MPESVVIGNDVETGREVRLGDVERRSGLYILGKPGMGKSALMVNIARQDLENLHPIIFLDPHREAISELLKRIPMPRFKISSPPCLLNPEDRDYSFGINLIRCFDTTNLTMVTDAYTRAYNVFYKLWEDSWGPWLQLILQNVLWAFIENQEYTLAEVPMFLNPRNTEFRNYILSNVKLNTACVDFWQYEFFQRRERDQQERADAALTRINTLLTHPYIRHIIGQQATTVNFGYYALPMPNLLLFELSANLPVDIKKFIGVMLTSELLHRVRSRPEGQRDQLCIFIDEFQNFASSDDMRTLITEGRKFGAAITFGHQERYGQFAEQQKLMGATLAAANKVLFQLTVKDGAELAPEVTNIVEATEKRREANLLPSPHAIEDIWDKGHPDKDIMVLRDKYFWIVDLLRSRPNDSSYVFSPSLIKPGLIENPRIFYWGEFEDEQSYRATPQMIREGLSLLNKYYYDCMANGYKEHPATKEDVLLMFTVLMKLGGMFGLFPTMNAYTSESGATRYLTLANEKIKRNFEEAKRVRIVGHPQNFNVLPKQLEYVPFGFPNDSYIREWQRYAMEAGMPDHEMEKFIVWEEKGYTPDGFGTLSEILRLIANMSAGPVSQTLSSLYEKYVAMMSHLPMQFKYGVDYLKIPKENTFAFFEKASRRVLWQILEINFFVQFLFSYIPFILAGQPVKVASGHYDETLKVERTQQDLVNEKAIELSGLPRYTTYAKVLFEKDNKQTVWTGKIQTKPLSQVTSDLEAVAIAQGHEICQKRVDIEAQIKERQEKWRVVASQTPNTPPEEPPPPTRF